MQGSASNDGDYTISDFSGTDDKLLGAGVTLVEETAGQRITITQIPKEVASASVDSTSSINLNKMLCLAVVDYVKAMIHEEEEKLIKRILHKKNFIVN